MGLNLKLKGGLRSEGFCILCGKQLEPNRTVWLEMRWDDATWHEVETVPQEFSQGCFEFGTACAKKALKASRQYEIERGDGK
jgi:hypothetical protein